MFLWANMQESTHPVKATSISRSASLGSQSGNVLGGWSRDGFIHVARAGLPWHVTGCRHLEMSSLHVTEIWDYRHLAQSGADTAFHDRAKCYDSRRCFLQVHQRTEKMPASSVHQRLRLVLDLTFANQTS